MNDKAMESKVCLPLACSDCTWENDAHQIGCIMCGAPLCRTKKAKPSRPLLGRLDSNIPLRNKNDDDALIKTVFSPRCTEDYVIRLRDRFRESPQQLISKIKQSVIAQFYIDLSVLNGHDGKKLYDVLSVKANGLNPETMKFFDWIIALCNT